MELGPEEVSLLERCPHFRGWYVQASMELGPEDVLERGGQITYVFSLSLSLSLSPVKSRLSISSASSDVGEGVVSVCHDNQCVSSPTHLSPELDYNPFPTSILGSDGESDPFDSSSPPDTMENG